MVRRGAADEIAQILSNEIISMQILPGTLLSRADLQRRFETSSTPVSDALLTLQSRRLVSIYPQHATKVSLIDAADAWRANFLRRSIELEVVSVLANTRSDVDVERLRSCLRHQEAVAAIDHIHEFTRLDVQFHQLMFEMANVGALWEVVTDTNGSLDRIRHLKFLMNRKIGSVIAEHRDLVDAIEVRDLGKARGVVARHLSDSSDVVEELVELHPQFFTKTSGQ